MAVETAVPLAQKLAFLIRPECYPNHPGKVETKETHMSWVFFSKDLVYKLKKPVKSDYLDFSTLEARFQDCHEEIRLNKRLAPGVYLGVVPLVINAEGNPLLEGEGHVIEWLVKMKRLPSACMLDERITNKLVKKGELQEAAELLAGFYEKQKAAPIDADTFIDRILAQAKKNQHDFGQSNYRINKKAIAEIYHSVAQFCQQHKRLFQERIYTGRVVEGHGDLRPEHICVRKANPVIIDCLEFNPDLRIVDAADELAFLSMECELLGAETVGEIFTYTYCRHTGDNIPPHLNHFYKCNRAFLRARLAINHLQDDGDENYFEKWRKKAGKYLKLAKKYSQK